MLQRSWQSFLRRARTPELCSRKQKKIIKQTNVLKVEGIELFRSPLPDQVNLSFFRSSPHLQLFPCSCSCSRHHWTLMRWSDFLYSELSLLCADWRLTLILFWFCLPHHQFISAWLHLSSIQPLISPQPPTPISKTAVFKLCDTPQWGA